MWKKVLLLIFVGFSTGCISLVGNPPTQSFEQGANHIVTPINITSVYTLESIDAPFTQISIPYHNVQSFAEQTNFRLLVRTSENKIRVINLSNRIIENGQTLSDTIINDPVVNENGFLIAQINRQNDKEILQVKNISTNEENSIDLPKGAVLAKWLDDAKLAIWASSTEGGCLQLLLIYDNFSTEVTYPTYPMPDLQKSECLQLPLVTGDGTKVIYPWQMFDFDTGISVDAFPFMRNFPQSPPAYSIKEVDENISLVHVNGDVLSYVLNIPLAEINRVDINPETILLPGLGTKEGWWHPFMWRPSQMQVGIDLIDKKIDPLELLVSGQQVPTRFYLIDLSAYKIFDYGLDRAVFVEGSPPQTIYEGFPSPDGKYFAWTIYDSSSRLPIGSKVLVLSSGNILSIPEVELLGWVVSKAE